MIALTSKSRTPSTLLGLSLDGTRLEAVLVRRTNGSLTVLKQTNATLTLNPLTGSTELVGREIRNLLDQAGIRERHCVLGLPLSWALTAQTTIPEIPEADVADFLALEAERAFPYSPDALSVATSRCQGGGEQHAMLMAIPRQHLLQLEAALRAAQLKPVSFTLGITALLDAGHANTSGTIALAPGENAVDLMIACHGGITALRSIDEAIEVEGVQKRLHAELLAREIRITVGQLPPALRGVLRQVRVFGSTDTAQRLVQELVPRLAPLGLQVALARAYAAEDFRSRPPADTPVSTAFSLAARHVTGVPNAFEFLPPKTSAWRQFAARFSSRKLGTIGAIAGAAAALALAAVLYQQWQLSQLGSRWREISPQVRDLEFMQTQIRRFRPWFDDSFRTLSILRRVTESFPETGVVTARTVEIRDSSVITCSGTARDNQSFLHMLDQLRASKEVGQVKVDQLRGKTPLQFTLNFQWGLGGSGDN